MYFLEVWNLVVLFLKVWSDFIQSHTYILLFSTCRSGYSSVQSFHPTTPHHHYPLRWKCYVTQYKPVTNTEFPSIDITG